VRLFYLEVHGNESEKKKRGTSVELWYVMTRFVIDTYTSFSALSLRLPGFSLLQPSMQMIEPFWLLCGV